MGRFISRGIGVLVVPKAFRNNGRSNGLGLTTHVVVALGDSNRNNSKKAEEIGRAPVAIAADATGAVLIVALRKYPQSWGLAFKVSRHMRWSSATGIRRI